jgi:hypothetical protein
VTERTSTDAQPGRLAVLVQTRRVAFEDLTTWPADLANEVNLCGVVRIRFPNTTEIFRRLAGLPRSALAISGYSYYFVQMGALSPETQYPRVQRTG